MIGIFTLAFISPVLPYGLITGTTLNLGDRLGWSIFFGIIVLAGFIFIGDLLFN